MKYEDISEDTRRYLKKIAPRVIIAIGEVVNDRTKSHGLGVKNYAGQIQCAIEGLKERPAFKDIPIEDIERAVAYIIKRREDIHATEVSSVITV